MECKYKRVVIKLSGEALAGSGSVLDYDKVDHVARVLKEISDQGVQIGVVVGGGNIFRGRSSGEMNRTDADHMGMLATAINALALKDSLIRTGAKAAVLSAIEMYQICESFAQREAVRRLEEGEIVIFACGSGRPYFSTDTAAALRALEIGADVLLCGKNIDGVYSADPRKDPKAVRYDRLTYGEVMAKNLQALDQAAFALCRDGHLPIFVFELKTPENLLHVIQGQSVGTYVGD